VLTFRYALLVPLFMAVATNTFAAPPNIKAAEAKGLQRVNLEELKKFIPGSIKVKGHKGGKYKLTFKADGSVDRTGGVNLDAQTGEWHFDEKNNAYCSAFDEVMGYQEVCFAVFRKPHKDKFFDYDIEDSFFAHGWRPLK
jgi:hypothetical protein